MFPFRHRNRANLSVFPIFTADFLPKAGALPKGLAKA
jgi:hypothetical protein